MSNDNFEFSINLLANKGIIEFNNFKWNGLKTTKLDTTANYIEIKQEYNIQNKKEIEDFDLSRYCELEVMKTSWKPIESLNDYRLVVLNMKEMFEPKLKINKIVWDDIGFLLFKVYLMGSEVGVIESKKELGIIIEIKNKMDKLSNEVKKNCLIYDRKNTIQIRQDDILIMYISKSK